MCDVADMKIRVQHDRKLADNTHSLIEVICQPLNSTNKAISIGKIFTTLSLPIHLLVRASLGAGPNNKTNRD